MGSRALGGWSGTKYASMWGKKANNPAERLKAAEVTALYSGRNKIEMEVNEVEA